MAYQNSTKPYTSDDEEPLVFKRSTASKQNQSNADTKKLSSQRCDGQPRRVSDVHSSNGVNSSAQKDKTAPSIKASPGKSPAAIPKEVSEKNRSVSIKEENIPIEHPPAENSDSDDDKPINSRLKAKINNVKKEDTDDEDNKPLAARVGKSNVGTSGCKPSNAKERKPLVQKNGSSTIDKGKSSSVASGKRPLEKGNCSGQSSIKKPKIGEPSTSAKSKQVSDKTEPKADDDDMTLSQRMKKATSASKSSLTKKTISKVSSSSIQKKIQKVKQPDKFSKYSKSTRQGPSSNDGQKKWTTLEHNGVIFPPPYKPHGVKMLYNGKPVNLTPEQEEVATMYAVMIDTEYVQKQTFRDNFWNDWRKLLGKNHVIQKLDACDFKPIYDWYQKEKEKKKQMSSEEKKAIKEEKLKQEEKFMWAVVDGVKEKVGNFRVEPPGLFRGRGEHPKSGKLKRRISPREVTINIGKNAEVPECPIPGERWKEVRHDNTVTWLAFWNDPINPKEFKYVFLAASSSLKGQSDKEKYEKARMLKDYIGDIRAAYTKDFTSRDAARRQIAVATYLIDKLALRAGNEKDDDEADTVGCCTLKVENVKAIPPNSLEFNFLGKDSIRYENTVEVEPAVYKEIKKFQEGKKDSDDLFDKLDTSKLNAHLKELMPGLTAKVFRTYNASITLDNELNQETAEGDVLQKKVFYDTANKKVAIICNHQRAVSKSHESQMDKLKEKLSDLQGVVKELKTDLERARNGKPPLKDADGKQKRNLTPEALQKKIADANKKIDKIKLDMQTKDDMKTIALGTSKINYLDPRITVAWCKRHEVPIEKIFQKSLLAKFAWSMDVDPDFRF